MPVISFAAVFLSLYQTHRMISNKLSLSAFAGMTVLAAWEAGKKRSETKKIQ
jgi:hypothetical protein